jgi:hypothetical protein
MRAGSGSVPPRPRRPRGAMQSKPVCDHPGKQTAVVCGTDDASVQVLASDASARRGLVGGGSQTMCADRRAEGRRARGWGVIALFACGVIASGSGAEPGWRGLADAVSDRGRGHCRGCATEHGQRPGGRRAGDGEARALTRGIARHRPRGA